MHILRSLLICINLKPVKIGGVSFWFIMEMLVLTVMSKGKKAILLDELEIN